MQSSPTHAQDTRVGSERHLLLIGLEVKPPISEALGYWVFRGIEVSLASMFAAVERFRARPAPQVAIISLPFFSEGAQELHDVWPDNHTAILLATRVDGGPEPTIIVHRMFHGYVLEEASPVQVLLSVEPFLKRRVDWTTATPPWEMAEAESRRAGLVCTQGGHPTLGRQAEELREALLHQEDTRSPTVLFLGTCARRAVRHTAQLLRAAGCRVHYGTGRNALERLASTQPDLVVCPEVLPPVGLAGVTRWIAEHRQDDVPAVVGLTRRDPRELTYKEEWWSDADGPCHAWVSLPCPLWQLSLTLEPFLCRLVLPRLQRVFSPDEERASGKRR